MDGAIAHGDASKFKVTGKLGAYEVAKSSEPYDIKATVGEQTFYFEVKTHREKTAERREISISRNQLNLLTQKHSQDRYVLVIVEGLDQEEPDITWFPATNLDGVLKHVSLPE